MVEEARRKKQEAKKPHIRVRDAETKLDAAKRAKEAATADVEAKQTALAKAVQKLAEAETKVATAQSELQEIRSTAYSESPADDSSHAKTKAAYEGLEQLRAVEMPPEARAALAAVAAGLPAKPPPPPPVGPALEAVAAAAKEEDMPMPSFDELPTERVNGPQVGRRRRSTSPGQRTWDSMRQMAQGRATDPDL